MKSRSRRCRTVVDGDRSGGGRYPNRNELVRFELAALMKGLQCERSALALHGSHCPRPAVEAARSVWHQPFASRWRIARPNEPRSWRSSSWSSSRCCRYGTAHLGAARHPALHLIYCWYDRFELATLKASRIAPRRGGINRV